MGTHPIFESDFDCLTEKDWSILPLLLLDTRCRNPWIHVAETQEHQWQERLRLIKHHPLCRDLSRASEARVLRPTRTEQCLSASWIFKRGARRNMPPPQPRHSAEPAQVSARNGKLWYQCDYGGAPIAPVPGRVAWQTQESVHNWSGACIGHDTEHNEHDAGGLCQVADSTASLGCCTGNQRRVLESWFEDKTTGKNRRPFYIQGLPKGMFWVPF